MNKVSIIGGGGTIGSAAGFLIALRGKYDEVCLIDLNRNLALNHVMDIDNAITGISSTRVYAGDMSDLKDSHVVIMTASVPNRNVTSRMAFLEDNLKIMDSVGAEIAKYAPEAIVIMASNPADLLNYYLYKKFDLKREKCIGYTLNDSRRFAWAIQGITGLKEESLFAPVIGEHGEGQVPLFSQVKVDGKPLHLSEEEKEAVLAKVDNWFVQFNQLNINRTSGWTSAVGLAEVSEALLQTEPVLMMESAILTGQYGLEGLSIGVPVHLNRNGVQEVLEWDLAEDELEKFKATARKIKETLAQIMPNG